MENSVTVSQVIAKVGGFENLKSKATGRQLHLATEEETRIIDGFVVLAYDPFPGNWRLTTWVRLGSVALSSI